MDKKRLIPGHKYIRRRKTTLSGRAVEAESWIKCVQVMQKGAVFIYGDRQMELTDEQIRKELREQY